VSSNKSVSRYFFDEMVPNLNNICNVSRYFF